MRSLLFFAIAFIIGLIILGSSVYILPEGEQAVITEFGKPIGENITDAGLKFKTPFIQKVHKFEKRLLEWDGAPNQIPTLDKKFIWLDTTARWKIVDALKFYQTLGTQIMAQSRLDDIMDSAARDLVTGQLLIEVVRDSNRVLTLDLSTLTEEEGQVSEPLEEIENGREFITDLILQKVQETVPQFGIEVIDLRIKRINYVDEVRQKVFQRMISERQRISEKYRSEGQGEAANIKGQKKKELEKISSEAYKEAEQIKGTADAKAIQIYADAHSKDSDFYAFLQTLETYQKTIGKNSTLVLSTDSALYKYLSDVR